jgi:hypothetical protein
MPLPIFMALAFASGIVAAVTGRSELRVTPRPPLLTRAYTSYAVFLALVLVPISVYFYVFHGDWFLLYLVDVERIPSALALLGFIAEMALGSVGFVLGSNLVRNQRDNLGMAISAVTVALSLIIVAVARSRLAVVGSYAQYTRRFGLHPYLAGTDHLGDSPVFLGTVTMSVVLAASFGYLIRSLRQRG